MNKRATPTYLILGRGPWGGKLARAITEMGRTGRLGPSPRLDSEKSQTAYAASWRTRLAADRPDIVWLAMPPCPVRASLATVAKDLGCMVVGEKPWLSEDPRVNAVTYQYIFTEGLSRLAETYEQGKNATIHLEFHHTRQSDRDPYSHLLSHLAAVALYWFPRARIERAVCSFGSTIPVRRLQLFSETTHLLADVDFLTAPKGALNAYMSDIETAWRNGRAPKADFDLSQKVNGLIDRFRVAASQSDRR